jgi:hypothetical protein
MTDPPRSDWRRATQAAVRIIGLSDLQRGSWMLAVILIVLGAAVMAAFDGQLSVVGAVLWVLGAVIAVGAWVRLMWSRRSGRTGP